MALETERDDVSDTLSTTVDGDTIYTPATSVFHGGRDHSCPPTIVGDEVRDGHCFPAVPWPGNTYVIIEKNSGRPIVRNWDSGVSLGKPKKASTIPAKSKWLCVETNNHIGFQNPKSGCYVGHNGNDCLIASAQELNEWE
ncbi:hypothetical protein PG985_003627 [Apiospora marii]|uniref:Uncharacterized protein n=1 Tax=Apiospora marii TaxID=335849 RepID=A0ABR1SJW4_9PEZI